MKRWRKQISCLAAACLLCGCLSWAGCAKKEEGMKITNAFTGGNITVVEQNEDAVYLQNEMRDTTGDWFYWAFCVEGAQGKTVTFWFADENKRLGYFGPAVSHDLKTWTWLWEKREADAIKFTYTFGEDEDKVYFAHSMLYHPDRFNEFAKEQGLEVKELCKSRKGNSVPCVTIGEGSKSVILTARHHACESTGSYVLEGVLKELVKNPIPDTRILCVPFVDYDGVIAGDQGKNRAPHDHNRDYTGESIYPEVAAIRAYAEENGCNYGFDFHSPSHSGGSNDYAFISRKPWKLDAQEAFGEILEAQVNANEKAFRYQKANDYPPNTDWDTANGFASYMLQRPENVVAFAFETTYFGLPNNRVSQENLVELGTCFARTMNLFITQAA